MARKSRAASKALTEKGRGTPAASRDHPGLTKIWFLNHAGVPLVEHACPEKESVKLRAKSKPRRQGSNLGTLFEAWHVEAVDPRPERPDTGG
jgi:hypothetical protein